MDPTSIISPIPAARKSGQVVELLQVEFGSMVKAGQVWLSTSRGPRCVHGAEKRTIGQESQDIFPSSRAVGSLIVIGKKTHILIEHQGSVRRGKGGSQTWEEDSSDTPTGQVQHEESG